MKQLTTFTRLGVISMAAMSLSACSTLGDFGSSLWSGTGKVASKSYNSVAGLFRPAPQRDGGGLYVGSDATLNTALLARRVSQQPSRQSYRPLSGLAVQRVLPIQSRPQLRGAYKMTRGAHASKGKPYKSYDAYEQKAQAFSAPDVPPSSDQGLSYVRLKGGVSMADFESCAQSSGGYFEQTRTGYRPNTGFDECMRAKGYISEAEAETRLAAYENALRSQNSFAP